MVPYGFSKGTNNGLTSIHFMNFGRRHRTRVRRFHPLLTRKFSITNLIDGGRGGVGVHNIFDLIRFQKNWGMKRMYKFKTPRFGFKGSPGGIGNN